MKTTVLYVNAQGRYAELPETTKFINEKQLVPNVGDFLTLVGKDHALLNIERTSLENIQTVTKRWYNYGEYDIAFICKYQPS